MSGLRLGELCAGYGGLGMAVEEVFGATSAWFSEFDDAPSKILAHHWPDVPNYGDMTKIDWAAIEPVDIISGGTPCQDLSAAGRRAGMTEGTRSNLWVQMREAIAIQKPAYVVWENVRGAYSATAASDLEQCPGCMGDTGDGGTVLRALGRVLGDLSDLGYDTQWRGLRAADVGACHGRFRVFVLAAHRDHIGVDRAWEGAEQNGRGQSTDDGIATADSDGQGLEVRGNPGVLPGAGGNDSSAPLGDQEPTSDTDRGDDAGRFGDALRGEEWREAATGRGEGSSPTPDASSVTIRQHPGKPSAEETRPGRCDGSCDSCGERHAGDGREAASDSGGDGRVGWQDHEGEGRIPGIGGEEIHHALHGRTPRPDTTNWGDYAPAITRWESVMGRRSPAPTEPTGRNGGHRLSPRFTEWMMGLPDGWVTDPAIGITRNEQLKACGNGVVPQQAMAALRDMLAAFQVAEVAA